MHRSTSQSFLIFLLAIPWMTLDSIQVAVAAQESAPIPFMPMPAQVQPGAGHFVIDSSLSLAVSGSTDARVNRAVERFLGRLSRQTGVTYGATPAATPNFHVLCHSDGLSVQKLGEDESYRLEVSPSGVSIEAPTPLGVIHALATLLQLARESPQGFVVPSMTIDDSPRFAWRGLLIDVSRHFMPVEVIKRNLDGMEAVKFNVLHWHLSDDQGFRVESKKLPKLQQLSSDGRFYTQEQIKDVIAYARDRGIRIVPEFDVPGHTTSWFVAYPDLASGPGPYQISRHFGVHDAVMNPAHDHTYHVLDDFIGEMSRLFPDEYFHIGGDEVNGKQWAANLQVRKFSRKHNLANHVDVQAYFNERLAEIVKKHGKIMVGWDEILHAKLPKDVVVQSWRGQKSLAEAVRQGYRGMLSFGYYLDLMHPAWQHYSVDPLNGAAANLSVEEKSRILGGEGCMWAELITADNIDERIWPRAAAIAERLWSAQELRDPNSMYARLSATSESLESIGLLHKKAYHTMLERLAAGSDAQSLRVLADVLEPVRDYTRNHTRPYETTTPLNRLVDAVQPESDAGRNFAAATAQVVSKTISADDLARLRAQLSLWEGNNQRLEPILQTHAILQEAQPLSQNLSATAAIAGQALNYLSTNGRAPAEWRDRQIAFLKEAQKPQAEMLLTIVPSVEKLVEATVPQ